MAGADPAIGSRVENGAMNVRFPDAHARRLTEAQQSRVGQDKPGHCSTVAAANL